MSLCQELRLSLFLFLFYFISWWEETPFDWGRKSFLLIGSQVSGRGGLALSALDTFEWPEGTWNIVCQCVKIILKSRSDIAVRPPCMVLKTSNSRTKNRLSIWSYWIFHSSESLDVRNDQRKKSFDLSKSQVAANSSTPHTGDALAQLWKFAARKHMFYSSREENHTAWLFFLVFFFIPS